MSGQKKIVLITGLILACFWLTTARLGQPKTALAAPPDQAPAGRYQLCISSQTNELYVIDSATAHIWQYSYQAPRGSWRELDAPPVK